MMVGVTLSLSGQVRRRILNLRPNAIISLWNVL
jgi:hypothetical protein